MANPALGLVAYGCDAGSGKIGDPGLQGPLEEYVQLYCDSALVVILEDSELLSVTAADYRDSILDQEGGDDTDTGTNPTINADEAKAKLQEATPLANKSKTLAYAGQYYDAAKSLDSAVTLVDSLSQN